jgi:hypothetical protein
MPTYHTISTPCDGKERCCHLVSRDPTQSTNYSSPCSTQAQCIFSEDHNTKLYDYEKQYRHFTDEEAIDIASRANA